MGASFGDRVARSPSVATVVLFTAPARERDALEMLERSHRRLEERLADLVMTAEAIAQGEAGDHALAVDDVLGFLERSATRHEVDEEGSVFPRLRRHLDLSPMLEALTAEHAHHHRLHGQLRELRAGWAADGPAPADGVRLGDLAAELDRAYRGHIEREEAELLPAARERLTSDERAAILDEMEERRGRDGHARGGRGGGGGGAGGGGGQRRAAEGRRLRER